MADTNTASAGVGLTDPTLSLGLSTISDWSTELPFLDLMKSSRPMWAYANTWESMDHAGLEASGVLDANGWPTEIPDGMTGVRTAWGPPDGTPGMGGPFVLTWEGEGTINLGSATIISTGDNRIVFTNPDSGTFWLDITSTDPGDTGDYIRDIRIVPAEYEALADAGEIFNPDFLAIIQDARQIRFMDWMDTNGSIQSEWTDRPQVNDVTWATYGGARNGVPVEIMVELANKIGADPWFNIPHMANDEYVTEFAAYVRDHLDPELVANVEYSNEMWNWAPAFDQTAWAYAQAQALWGTDQIEYIPPTNLDYQAMRATQVALIWDQVFGADAEARVENVLGLQNGNNWWLQYRMLNGLVWQTKDPEHFVSPASVFDAVAVTTYFGGEILSTPALRNELLSYLGSHSTEQTFDWFAAKLLDPAYASSIPAIVAAWSNVQAVTDANGLDLIAYEGGQHVHMGYSTSGMTAQQISNLDAFMTAFVRSEQMADLYSDLWDAWAQVGDGPFMQLVAVSNSSWGLMRNNDDSTPRGDFLFDKNAQQDSWFGDGGGTRYLGGVIKIAGNGGETLTGTDKNDTLVGGSGNDILIAGRGTDRLSGGAGNDTFHVGAGTPFIVDTAGWDTMVSSIGRDMNDYAFIENLTLTGTANINVIGNAWSNTIIGNDGDNVIDGGGGNDTLKGGLGNDTYVLGGSNDTVVDTGGNDTITSTATRDLRNYTGIENLTLTFGAYVDGTGNDVANVITGNSGHNTLLGLGGNDTLYGNAGNDILDGGAGTDILNGGAGNDTYVLADGNDTVIDSAGIDTITSSITRDLNNYIDIEHLTLSGTTNINGTGNKWSNTITGNSGNNSLWGNDGNDTLIGGAGADKLYGGTGNDVLQGGAGSDTLTGGVGNDTYVLEDGTDIVIDEGGWDTITSSISRDLNNYPDIEILTLTGTANINGTGNKWSNTINGNDGDNILDGGAGSDTLVGGLGNDTYVITSATNDTIIDIGGIDTIASTSSRDLRTYTGIENLTLTFGAHVDATGDANANKLTGNSGNNVLRGLAGNDVLDGAGGHDTIIGGLGTDTLTGGAGRDVFRFESLADSVVGAGRDIIRDFARSQDTIDLSAITDGGTLLNAGAAFTGVEDQIRWYQVDLSGTASDVTRVELDANGDGVADFELELSGLHALTRSDFLL